MVNTGNTKDTKSTKRAEDGIGSVGVELALWLEASMSAELPVLFDTHHPLIGSARSVSGRESG